MSADQPGPLTWVFNAALSSLHHWVLNGALPARAHRIALSDDNTAFTRDERGMSKAASARPYVDEPAAVLSGEPNSGASFCFLFGTTALFDAATMASRYVDKANYIKVGAQPPTKRWRRDSCWPPTASASRRRPRAAMGTGAMDWRAPAAVVTYNCGPAATRACLVVVGKQGEVPDKPLRQVDSAPTRPCRRRCCGGRGYCCRRRAAPAE